ncbi:MAG: Hsp20/alpha crystallin family protein [Sedimentisphaerales bacterium]|nr:Hsp20/alpha crystallin family protein [Sedimentisphaerales bacterium]
MALVPIQRTRNDGLATLHHEMDDLFDSFFRGLERPLSGYKAWPAIDIAEQDNAIVVRAEVPGCKAEDVEISVFNNKLTISGEKKASQEKKEKGYYYSESSYGSFRRELALPTDVDQSKIDAVCKDGVLAITLPKSLESKAMKVKVKG